MKDYKKEAILSALAGAGFNMFLSWLVMRHGSFECHLFYQMFFAAALYILLTERFKS